MARTPTHTHVEFTRFPALPGVELRYSCYREQVFRTHTHPAWSVGLIESGSTEFTLSGRHFCAETGQMVVIDPGRAHACNPGVGGSISYQMFYLSREWLAPATPDRGFPHFAEPVIDDAELFALWDSLRRAFAADPASATRAPLEAAIATLVGAHAEPVAKPLSAREIDGVAAAKRVLREQLDRRVTIEQLARATGLSRSHLTRTFTAVEGLPPHTYHNQLRVERAKELLAAGEPITAVASAAGFSDQSHLTRVFREFTGATPRQYQAADTSEA